MSKFTGRFQLVERLAYQLGGGEAGREKAVRILQQQGLLDPLGFLTPEGKKRDAMTASERALDRASRETGKPTSAFSYDPNSNRVQLRGSFAPRRKWTHGA